MSNVRIYAAGGMGSNICSQIKDLDLDVAFVDTSRSNLRGVNEDQIFLVPDLDGAGKNRIVTYEGFKDIVEEVLIRFKPSDTLNIVVSSLSGGSGAIINSSITRELLLQDKPVVVVVVDSTSSGIEISNSVKSLKTFKAISNQVQKSVSVFYVENISRKEADKEVINFINLLALLTDKHNTEEFDSTDMRNFIQFQNVTEYEPDVSILEISANEIITPEKGTVVVSSILVTTDTNTQISEVIPEYLATCIVVDESFVNQDIRVDNILGKLTILVDRLEDKLQEMSDNRRINKFKEVEVTNATDDGIVI